MSAEALVWFRGCDDLTSHFLLSFTPLFIPLFLAFPSFQVCYTHYQFLILYFIILPVTCLFPGLS